ncbi:hypothetical protein ACFL6F_04045 [Planctomycetota bacterium]
MTDPSPIDKDRKKRPAFTLDKMPASRHTYNGLTYIAHADRFFAHGGVLAGTGYTAYGPVNITWTFDFSAKTWHYMKPKGDIAAGSSESLCV